MNFRAYLGFAAYMGLALVFLGPIFITPFIAENYPALSESIHAIYAPACHQLAERSLCYFQNHADDNSSASPSKSYFGLGGGTLADCAQPGTSVIGRQQAVDVHGVLGYKFPVCARDMAIYGAMLLGGFVFPFVRRIDDKIAPPLVYFIFAIIPIAVDGGTQFLGLRQSTNELRLITGFIAGIAVPFYVIPILNAFILGREGSPGSESRRKTKQKR